MTNYQETPPVPLNTEKLLFDSLKHIVKHEDPQEFLFWIRNNIDKYFTDPEFTPLTHGQLFAAMAAQLGREIWNHTPLPGNNFRPNKLPKPEKNGPCICGSGIKYKNCCGTLPSMQFVSDEDIWPLLYDVLPQKQIDNAVKQRKIPINAVIDIAIQLEEEDNLAKAIHLLETLFLPSITKTNEAADYALNLLCNYYDETKSRDKKLLLLNNIIEHAPRSTLRSGAWQRLATIFMDNGDESGAWDAFKKAQREDPNSISLGPLEVQLHIASENLELAQSRAKFWIKRMIAQGCTEENSPLEFMRAIAENPQQAMSDVRSLGVDEDIIKLRKIVKQLEGLPKLVYDLEIIETEEAEHHIRMPQGTEVELFPPQNIARLEKKWQRVFTLPKPFSTLEQSNDEDDIWSPFDAEHWLEFLEQNPNALNSLEIIDDVLNAIAVHDNFPDIWIDEELLIPLGKHAKSIIDNTIAKIEKPQISWLNVDSRPVLRSLVRLSHTYHRMGYRQLEQELNTQILQLNPYDNHGLRSFVINQLLEDKHFNEALAIIQIYPDDIMADPIYGKVLAYYSLGDTQQASAALADAIDKLPKIVRYLTHKRVKEPKFSGYGISIGGDDQAWHYREEMKDVWDNTPGAIDWLKKTAKQIEKEMSASSVED